MWRSWNSLGYWQEYKMVQPLGKNLAVLKKIKHGATTWPNNPTPRNISKRNENTCPLENLCLSVHSTIRNSQKAEMSQMWPAHTTGHCLAVKRTGELIHAATQINTKRKKPVAKDHITKASMYTKCPEQADPKGKQMSCPWGPWGVGIGVADGYGVSFQGN